MSDSSLISNLVDRFLSVDSEDPNIQRRGRALGFVFTIFALLTTIYIPYVLVMPIYDGKRPEFLGLLLGLAAFFGFNSYLCTRGKLDTAVVLVGSACIVGPTAGYIAVEKLTTTMWLMNVACLLSCFAIRPRQAIFLLGMALSSLAFCAWFLHGKMPGDRLYSELIRLVVMMVTFSLLSYLTSAAHRRMVTVFTNSELATREAMLESQRQRQLAETERKRAEAANEAKTQFLAGMSHELRTPLNAILGYSEILYEELSDLDEAPDLIKEDAKSIQTASRHLLELIQDVLDLSDIESGELEMKPKDFDLKVMCEDIVTSMELAAATNDNELFLHYDLAQDTFHSDPTWIRQILFNLLSNAAKFTEDGEIHLRIYGDAKRVTMSVEDTGVGMSEAQQARIFDEFVQADDLTVREFGGTGLGLPLCHALAARMGGGIEMESEVGEGTQIAVVVPRSLEEVAA